MRLEESSLYGKVIIPWYDSDAMLTGTIAAMAVVFFFAVGGVVVAYREPAFRFALWVPATLVFLSFLVFASASVRLFQRRRLRRGSADR